MADKFVLKSSFKPKGSQPEAINKLVAGLKEGKHFQTLLGVTGSGKSLDYNDQLLVHNFSGFIEKLKIGDFVEKNLKNPKSMGNTSYDFSRGYRVLSFDPVKKLIEEKDILELSRHKEGFVYEISLDNGSKINVTKDHNCFRFRDCSLDLCKTEDLHVGEYLPTSARPMLPKKFLKFINILDHYDSAKLDVRALVAKNTHSSLLKVLKKRHRAPNWKLQQIISGTNEGGIDICELKEYTSLLRKNFSNSLKKVKLINRKNRVPAIIEIDDNFLTFMGLYVSEGHGTNRYVTISNSNLSLQKKCMSFWKSLCLNYNIRNKNDIQYNSVALARFCHIFGKTAKYKNIPSLFYNLSDKHISVFLRAIFDGDGYVERNSANLTSASEELVNDLKNILLRYSITSRIRTKIVNSKKYYLLSISGRRNLIRFSKNISFSLEYKKEALTKTIRETENTNVDLIPDSSGFIKKIRADYSLSQMRMSKLMNCERSFISMIESGKRNPSKKIMKNLFHWLEKKDKKFSYLKNLLDFNFGKIVGIKRVKSFNGYVYDISVKDNENFAAGLGNIFVHNTFTTANVIAAVQKPALVIVHNKTLAAQLYNELKEFFPDNRVEYFVSYYDYYQPESYLPSKDLYIEKESQVNPKIEMMRLSATASILSRRDTIIVASVSCIYGLGNPKNYRNLGFDIEVKQKISRKELLKNLIVSQYERNDTELMPGRFRVKGDTIDLVPSFYNNIIRIDMFGDSIESITEIDKNTGEKLDSLKHYLIFPAKHFVIPESDKRRAMDSIRAELEEHLPKLELVEAHRLKQRTLFDLEMIEETGYCSGVENYSRHFDNRKKGEKPYTLMDYFPDDFLLIIDESHQTVPQLHGMYNGDKARKKNLVDYGWRLPCAFDNRPLKFEEFEKYMHDVVFVSATPAEYELSKSSQVVEQIIRPTGLVDPTIEVRKTKGQIEDLLKELNSVIKAGNRALVTTLTKKLAEELSEFLSSKGVKTRYLHSEIDTLERNEIIRELRLGKFDVLVGINLLREGLDIPEVGFIGILDADKEGFLRDARSLIQITGRAARNVDSHVVLYADNMTDSMKKAIAETKRRREIQIEYNKKHKITPKTIIKPIRAKEVDITDIKHIPKNELANVIIELESDMKNAADTLDFEKAIAIRDRLKKLKERVEN